VESLENSGVVSNEENKDSKKSSTDKIRSKKNEYSGSVNATTENIKPQDDTTDTAENTTDIATPNYINENPTTNNTPPTIDTKSTNTTSDIKDKKKRKHKKYKQSINHTALKDLEGTTASSFLDLAKAVIIVDGKPYDDTYLTLSKERKNDFKRLIDHYADVDTIGKRKYYIKRVYSKEEKKELQGLEIELLKDKKKK
jgi:hypothetical protein